MLNYSRGLAKTPAQKSIGNLPRNLQSSDCASGGEKSILPQRCSYRREGRKKLGNSRKGAPQAEARSLGIL
ncbi:MAG: hypothetical protein A2849_02030 [Candidatus Taylorbacteria bacterium RIFCSPHIGHO2_01_FULL_51_15]|uniref:Uncharacterized protein n=1 Tax=Candidatus Taylorbacteria bacterium RIFCSPHIGHO2_01_FULL_51_15 TaxID=1802304 RepID=A0A1G2MB86_9BACT|nr:MAG: hypothetical protein A2849_02030 [Candidatus Taylorbacteria bacterium RIFCSPHIGHO2_01_FULL_51_15]